VDRLPHRHESCSDVCRPRADETSAEQQAASRPAQFASRQRDHPTRVWPMSISADALVKIEQEGSSGPMVFVPGGTFRMGSDEHYPEEAPAHRVTVDGFWIDRHPVTNRQFREFARATRHVTVAEITP